jgi:ribulose-phosphate 3-epimerase
LPECDLVLVMSVQPGFGGQAFQPAAVDKARQVREQAAPGTLLSIDGGIGRETIPQCAGVEIDLFVVGSAIFEAHDYRSAIDELRSLAAPQTR